MFVHCTVRVSELLFGPLIKLCSFSSLLMKANLTEYLQIIQQLLHHSIMRKNEMRLVKGVISILIFTIMIISPKSFGQSSDTTYKVNAVLGFGYSYFITS